MSENNSSLTRVQPVLNPLLTTWPDGEPWVGDLWSMAALTRPGTAAPTPASVGRLLPAETPSEPAARLGKVFERTVAPPSAFLRWLLEHPTAMEVRDPVTFGAKSDIARAWRTKLFSTDVTLIREAQDEGKRQLAKRLAERGRRKWWAFEGFSHIDCCLITDRCVLFIEGKRTDRVAPSTLWFKQRSQLWRNVEAAEQFAAGKDFAVILAVEREADGDAALTAADASLAPSFPHLPAERQRELSRHLIGFVTWLEIVTRFGLPPECLPETVG
jgi:hypothetical protein